jgi:type IV pilus assembly protein PilE
MKLFKWQKHSGFSLLELIMALMVFSIVSVIAVPAYQQQLYKSRRSDAQASLISLQLAQEQYRANCLQYATTLASNSNCNSDGHYTLSASAISLNHYYQLSIQSATSTSYILTATATGIQLGDSNCQTFSIDQDGNKSARSSNGQIANDCW